MNTIDLIISKVDMRRGAPMGRANVGKKPQDAKIYDQYVPMNHLEPAYDKGGAYWGIGRRLRVSYTKDLKYIHFYRSPK
jgi:hypothetical protein